MLTHWLMIGLLVSVAALVLVAGAIASHVWRHRRQLNADAENTIAQKEQHRALDRALGLEEQVDAAGPADQAPRTKIG